MFTCSVSGYGHQSIKWHKRPGPLPQKVKTNEIKSHGIVTSTLIIPNVTEEDVGKYCCHVWANNIAVKSNKAHLYYSGTCVSTYVAVCIFDCTCAQDHKLY